MRKSLVAAALLVVAFAAPKAKADTVSYNTSSSTLSCGTASSCTQDTSDEISIGGLTFTYNAGSGSNVSTPSIINLGNIVSTGTGSSVNMTGVVLTIDVFSTPPGSGGDLPNGTLSGSLSTNNSGTIITFSPNNTTSGFGTLPGVMIGSELYQVLNPTLGLQAPTVGNPVGQTSIQGAVTSTPEPGSALLLFGGIALLGLMASKRSAFGFNQAA